MKDKGENTVVVSRKISVGVHWEFDWGFDWEFDWGFTEVTCVVKTVLMTTNIIANANITTGKDTA